MRPLTRIIGTALAACAFVAVAGRTASHPTSRPVVHPATDESALDPNDPVIAACTATSPVCDPGALSEDQATTPYYAPLPAGTALVAEAAAVTTALTEFHAPEGAPAAAHLTTGAEFTLATGVTRPSASTGRGQSGSSTSSRR